MLLYLFTSSTVLITCITQNKEDQRLDIFSKYFQALSKGDGSHWQYLTDTVRFWFDEKKGAPQLNIKNAPKGKWSEWDKEMHAGATYDSLWYDKTLHAVKGFFYENNDFYRLIGKPPTKTLRTYTFNDKNKISEMIIYWIPEENKETGYYLNPVYDWAKKYHPSEIEALYPNKEIVPSAENAAKWKILLKQYNQFSDSVKRK